MAEQTAIEWCDSTFNPWIGCTKVSPACDDCYAARSTPARTLGVAWGPGQPRRRTGPDTWEAPRRWQRQAAAFQARHGRRRRVFCASLADVFDNEVPLLWRQHLMSLVADTPDLDWLFLTKRIGNAARMLSDASMHDGRLLTADDRYRPPQNLWLGATVVNQAEADRDVPKLLATPAAVRFLSIEPMLGPIDLSVPLNVCQFDDGSAWSPRNLRSHDTGLHWVICGGESGPKARPMSHYWPRDLRDQCAAAGVPFLFKQWGEWIGAADLRDLPGGKCPGFGAFDHCTYDMAHEAVRIGKKAAGRLLDGKTHDAWPETHHG